MPEPATDKPTPNKCIAYKCGAPLEAGRHFCKFHFEHIPHYLRVALKAEMDELAKGSHTPDIATKALVSACVYREMIVRAEVVPGFREQLEADEKAQFEARLPPAPRLVDPNPTVEVVKRDLDWHLEPGEMAP